MNAKKHNVESTEGVEGELDKNLENANKAEEVAAQKLIGSRKLATRLDSKKIVSKTDNIGSKDWGLKKEVNIKLGPIKLSLTKQMLLLLVLNTVLVGCILVINYFMFRSVASIYSSINLISIFIFIFPIVMLKYSEYKTRKEIEEMFPVFLRDFVETIRGGMTVPHALKAVSRNDYRALSPHVRKMAVQLNWGVPVERVLLNFSKRVGSRLIARIISSVRESHRFGGNLADTLEALSNTAVEVERLREERKLYLHSQMITGYIIFFVFLAVIVALEKFLVPALTEFSGVGITGEKTALSENTADEFKTIFLHLILLQGFFAGLAVGKMAEGAIVGGLKHSVIMMAIGFLVFTLAVGPGV